MDNTGRRDNTTVEDFRAQGRARHFAQRVLKGTTRRADGVVAHSAASITGCADSIDARLVWGRLGLPPLGAGVWRAGGGISLPNLGRGGGGRADSTGGGCGASEGTPSIFGMMAVAVAEASR